MNYGKIRWLYIEGIYLIVECMFIKDVKDCINFVKIWKIYMKGDFMRMIDGLCVEEINVKDIVW